MSCAYRHHDGVFAGRRVPSAAVAALLNCCRMPPRRRAARIYRVCAQCVARRGDILFLVSLSRVCAPQYFTTTVRIRRVLYRPPLLHDIIISRALPIYHMLANNADNVHARAYMPRLALRAQRIWHHRVSMARRA